MHANRKILSKEEVSTIPRSISKEKFKFPFELISDSDEKVCKIFDVIKEKSMYGKKYMGIERSTFLIGPDRKLIHEWRKVKVKDHVKEILKLI